jgi:hypothetical protein
MTDLVKDHVELDSKAVVRDIGRRPPLMRTNESTTRLGCSTATWSCSVPIPKVLYKERKRPNRVRAHDHHWRSGSDEVVHVVERPRHHQASQTAMMTKEQVVFFTGAYAVSALGIAYLLGVIGGGLFGLVIPGLLVAWGASAWLLSKSRWIDALSWAVPCAVLIYGGILLVPYPVGLVPLLGGVLLLGAMVLWAPGAEWWASRIGSRF